MKSLIGLKIFLASTGIWLLALFFLLFCFSSACFAQEQTYVITQTQLTALEANLSRLKEQNSLLQEQLTQSKIQVQSLQTQSTELQEQVNLLKQFLTNAQTLLTQYETSLQEDKDYAAGLGIGTDGIAFTADIKNIWFVVDSETGIIGYKVRF